MQRIPSTPTKTVSSPTKTASTPNIDLRCFVARQFFVAKLRTFLAYNLQAKNYGGVQKMTKMRYDQLHHICLMCIHYSSFENMRNFSPSFIFIDLLKILTEKEIPSNSTRFYSSSQCFGRSSCFSTSTSLWQSTTSPSSSLSHSQSGGQSKNCNIFVSARW